MILSVLNLADVAGFQIGNCGLKKKPPFFSNGKIVFTEFSWGRRRWKNPVKMVGAVRFELTTSCTRNKRASQATLRPDTINNQLFFGAN